jgi:hypothetical protein
LLEYLEYIGMLEPQGYLALDDIDYILGSVCIDVYAVMARHIDRVRANQAESRRTNDLARMPDDYVCFSRLTRKFTDRYSAP